MTAKMQERAILRAGMILFAITCYVTPVFAQTAQPIAPEANPYLAESLRISRERAVRAAQREAGKGRPDYFASFEAGLADKCEGGTGENCASSNGLVRQHSFSLDETGFQALHSMNASDYFTEEFFRLTDFKLANGLLTANFTDPAYLNALVPAQELAIGMNGQINQSMENLREKAKNSAQDVLWEQNLDGCIDKAVKEGLYAWEAKLRCMGTGTVDASATGASVTSNAETVMNPGDNPNIQNTSLTESGEPVREVSLWDLLLAQESECPTGVPECEAEQAEYNRKQRDTLRYFFDDYIFKQEPQDAATGGGVRIIESSVQRISLKYDPVECAHMDFGGKTVTGLQCEYLRSVVSTMQALYWAMSEGCEAYNTNRPPALAWTPIEGNNFGLVGDLLSLVGGTGGSLLSFPLFDFFGGGGGGSTDHTLGQEGFYCGAVLSKSKEENQMLNAFGKLSVETQPFTCDLAKVYFDRFFKQQLRSDLFKGTGILNCGLLSHEPEDMANLYQKSLDPETARKIPKYQRDEWIPHAARVAQQRVLHELKRAQEGLRGMTACRVPQYCEMANELIRAKISESELPLIQESLNNLYEDVKERREEYRVERSNAATNVNVDLSNRAGVQGNS